MYTFLSLNTILYSMACKEASIEPLKVDNKQQVTNCIREEGQNRSLEYQIERNEVTNISGLHSLIMHAALGSMPGTSNMQIKY